MRAGVVAAAAVGVGVLTLTSVTVSVRPSGSRLAIGHRTDAGTTPSTEPGTTTTAVAPVTTSTLPPPPLPGIGAGARGPEVLAIQHRLKDLHYDPGALDGVFATDTQYAVQSFQKVVGLPRTGRVTDDVKARLDSATDPAPLLAGGGPTRVEIDLARQVLFLYKDGALRLITTVSTGTGKRFCVDHDDKGRPTPRECDYAVTPGGSFRFTWRFSGWWTSRLGHLFNPVYFNGGIAIHGSDSVPPYPASHGCIRIPLGIANYFPGLVARGDPVYVFGGPQGAPVPLNDKAPQETTSTTATTTTSTTHPSTTTTGLLPSSTTTTTTTRP